MMMNTLNQPEITVEEDLIATQTVDRAEDGCIDSNKLTQTPEANTEDVISSELKDANKLVAELISSLMVMSAIEQNDNQEIQPNMFVETIINPSKVEEGDSNDEAFEETDEDADIRIKVIPLDGSQTKEQEYAIAA